MGQRIYRILGRDRLEIQIRKLNKVSSYLLDRTVSQIQQKLNACIYGQHQRGLENNTRHRENCLEAGFAVSDFSFRVIENRSLGFGESDVESDIRISNRSRPMLINIFGHRFQPVNNSRTA